MNITIVNQKKKTIRKKRKEKRAKKGSKKQKKISNPQELPPFNANKTLTSKSLHHMELNHSYNPLSHHTPTVVKQHFAIYRAPTHNLSSQPPNPIINGLYVTIHGHPLPIPEAIKIMNSTTSATPPPCEQLSHHHLKFRLSS